MPNWCDNTLTVSGDKKDIKKFKEKAHNQELKTDLSLANLYPEPDYTKVKVKSAYPEIKGQEFAEPESAWWDWRVQNWGTKWDVEAELTCEEDEYLQYCFMSAWSPPSAWLEKVGADFPGLSFQLKYDEPGMGFMGVSRSVEGEFYDQAIEY